MLSVSVGICDTVLLSSILWRFGKPAKHTFAFGSTTAVKMSSFYIFCVLAIWSTVVSSNQNVKVVSERSFVIDYENNQYLKDGEHFRFISGSIHYFRVPRIHWQDRLEKMAAAGLNAVETYVEWSQHEPYPGTYNFQDNLDVVEFIKLAQKLGLLVILRPGPYICAERELGGFPFWLLQTKPNIYLRSSDPTYIKYVDLWFAKLLPMLTPLLYSNGGPIISVQVENEFGGYTSCDFTYTAHLRDLIRSFYKNQVILHTTDNTADSTLKCGKIDEVYATIDFGTGTNVTQAFQIQRNHQARGPMVNSEFYPGWFDNWGGPHHTTPAEDVVRTIRDILAINASVNIYMFHGGTNFGFTNGADGGYIATTTSYDYDAPLSEAGDPTPKYFAIRKLIANFTKAPLPPVPKPVPKFGYGTVKMSPIGSLFDLKGMLQSHKPIYSKYPVTFESLGQAYGFVLYETSLKNKAMDPAILNAAGVRDRAIIFLDEIPVGILNVQDNNFNIPLTISIGQKLSILVENMGRLKSSDSHLQFKGLISNVTLDGKNLTDWTITPFPLNNSKEIDFNVKKLYFDGFNVRPNLRLLPNKRYYAPGVFVGSFVVPNNASFPMDTFFNPTGWNKGVVFVNGFNLGRYWPVVGPQITLYLPKSALKPYPTPNTIMMFELENAPCGPSNVDKCTIQLVDTPILDGDTP